MQSLYTVGKERGNVEEYDADQIRGSGEVRRICEFDLKIGALAVDSIEVSMRKDIEAD